MLSFMVPDATSTSRNSPGAIGVSSPFTRRPLVLNPPGKLDNVPASTNWRSNDVLDLANAPIKWIRPKA